MFAAVVHFQSALLESRIDLWLLDSAVCVCARVCVCAHVYVCVGGKGEKKEINSSVL